MVILSCSGVREEGEASVIPEIGLRSLQRQKRKDAIMIQAGKDASPVGGEVPDERHRPQATLLEQLVDSRYPGFADRMVAQKTLYTFVTLESEKLDIGYRR